MDGRNHLPEESLDAPMTYDRLEAVFPHVNFPLHSFRMNQTVSRRYKPDEHVHVVGDATHYHYEQIREFVTNMLNTKRIKSFSEKLNYEKTHGLEKINLSTKRNVHAPGLIVVLTNTPTALRLTFGIDGDVKPRNKVAGHENLLYPKTFLHHDEMGYREEKTRTCYGFGTIFFIDNKVKRLTPESGHFHVNYSEFVATYPKKMTCEQDYLVMKQTFKNLSDHSNQMLQVIIMYLFHLGFEFEEEVEIIFNEQVLVDNQRFQLQKKLFLFSASDIKKFAEERIVLMREAKQFNFTESTDRSIDDEKYSTQAIDAPVPTRHVLMRAESVSASASFNPKPTCLDFTPGSIFSRGANHIVQKHDLCASSPTAQTTGVQSPPPRPSQASKNLKRNLSTFWSGVDCPLTDIIEPEASQAKRTKTEPNKLPSNLS